MRPRVCVIVQWRFGVPLTPTVAQTNSRSERVVEPCRSSFRLLFAKNAFQTAAEAYRRKTAVGLHIPRHRSHKFINLQLPQAVVKIRTRTLGHECVTVVTGERHPTVLCELSQETTELPRQGRQKKWFGLFE